MWVLCSPGPQGMGCGGFWQQLAGLAPGGVRMESSSSRDRDQSSYPASLAPAFGVSVSVASQHLEEMEKMKLCGVLLSLEQVC